MSDDLQNFAAKIAEMGLTQADAAVALLWFQTHLYAVEEMTAKQLAEMLYDSAITSKPNISRLSSQLDGHPDLVRGRSTGAFKLRLVSKGKLTEKYEVLLLTRKASFSSDFLPTELTAGTRGYVEKIAAQINGSYYYEFFDGGAVLLRRLVEILLIEAFAQTGNSAAVMKGRDFLSLSEIISQANSGKFIRLSRGMDKVLEKVKRIGDAAAHHRTYISMKSDLDEVKLDTRRLIAELLHLAGFR